MNSQDIYSYSTTTPLTCYIASLTTVPGPHQHQYGVRLIYDVALFLRNLGARGVKISKFYAIGASEQGRKLGHQLGFTEIYTSPDGNRSGFVLNADSADSKLARYYQSGIQEMSSNKIAVKK